MGLALSLYEILTLDKRWNKTSGSKNWTTDVNGVVLERKKSQTKPYFPNCDRAHKTKQDAMACWTTKTNWKLGFEGAGICGQGNRRAEVLDITRKFHFVLNPVPCCAYTEQMSLRPGCKELQEMRMGL